MRPTPAPPPRSPGARGIALDVTDPSHIEAAVAEIVRDFGRLDVVVNNAGVNTMAHRVTIDEFPRGMGPHFGR